MSPVWVLWILHQLFWVHLPEIWPWWRADCFHGYWFEVGILVEEFAVGVLYVQLRFAGTEFKGNIVNNIICFCILMLYFTSYFMILSLQTSYFAYQWGNFKMYCFFIKCFKAIWLFSFTMPIFNFACHKFFFKSYWLL